MDDAEADFLVDAILFIADKGYIFLSSYQFDMSFGSWQHIKEDSVCTTAAVETAFGVSEMLKRSSLSKARGLKPHKRHKMYKKYLNEAHLLASKLNHAKQKAGEYPVDVLITEELEPLIFFTLGRPLLKKVDENEELIDQENTTKKRKERVGK